MPDDLVVEVIKPTGRNRKRRPTRVTFRTPGGVAVLEWHPEGRRFIDPVTGETGRCDSEDQARDAALARLVLLEPPVVMPSVRPAVYNAWNGRSWNRGHHHCG